MGKISNFGTSYHQTIGGKESHFLTLFTLCVQLRKNNIHLAFFDVIAAFTFKVNFYYFLVSSFRIKVLLIANFNLKREIIFVSSTGTIIMP